MSYWKCSQVKVDKRGYTSEGEYIGKSEALFMFTSVEGTTTHRVRAPTRKEAWGKLRRVYPDATRRGFRGGRKATPETSGARVVLYLRPAVRAILAAWEPEMGSVSAVAEHAIASWEARMALREPTQGCLTADVGELWVMTEGSEIVYGP